ncbi:MAG: protein phosphatase 2C domain-containing protein [Paracoccaceae bacterium]
MNIEAFSRCKYRAVDCPGDDVPFILPGIAIGLFDGATDAKGALINSTPAGRMAALNAAECTAQLLIPPENRKLPARELVNKLSTLYAKSFEKHSVSPLPATTLALAIDCGENWRFFCLGDSAIRVNGSETLRHTKLIDDVSTFARVALFHDLSKRLPDLESAEMAARRGIFLGFDDAVEKGIMGHELADNIITETIVGLSLQNEGAIVRAFLTAGICMQYRFANEVGNSLCYDVLADGTPQIGDWVDVWRPKEDVQTIEVFSDGYAKLPDNPTVAAWEAAFEATDKQDFQRISEYTAVKGGTENEFFDDRTVVIVQCPRIQPT